jgi:hypothetical protein
MNDLLWIFVSTLLINNFVLAYFLGICPFLGVSQRLDTAFRLGMATSFVMLVTGLCVWFLNTYILEHAPYLRLISASSSSSPAAVQLVEMVLKKLQPGAVPGPGDLPAAHHHQLRRSRARHLYHQQRLWPGGGDGLCPGVGPRLHPRHGADGRASTGN